MDMMSNAWLAGSPASSGSLQPTVINRPGSAARTAVICAPSQAASVAFSLSRNGCHGAASGERRKSTGADLVEWALIQLTDRLETGVQHLAGGSKADGLIVGHRGLLLTLAPGPGQRALRITFRGITWAEIRREEWIRRGVCINARW